MTKARKKTPRKPRTASLAVTPCSPSSERLLGTGFYRNTKPGDFGRDDWLDLLMACQDGRATCMRVLEIIEREMDLQRPSAHDMAEAFLRWPLPASVCADHCTTYPVTSDNPALQRVGTNLLSYVEAKQMFEHVLANVEISHGEQKS